MGWMSRSFVERPNELRLAEQNAISRANLKSFLQLGATQESGQFDRRSVAETFCNLSAMGLGSRLSFGEWQTGEGRLNGRAPLVRENTKTKIAIAFGFTCKVRHVNCESRILLTTVVRLRYVRRSANLMRLIGSPEERKRGRKRPPDGVSVSFSLSDSASNLMSEHPSIRPRFDVHCSFSKSQGVEEGPSYRHCVASPSLPLASQILIHDRM